MKNDVQMDEGNPPDEGVAPLWAIVLAAGEGTRLSQVTRMLHGRAIPKQFALLDGDRTLLQSTLDRMAAVVPPERTVVVIAAERHALAAAQLSHYPGLHIVDQPANLGTGPGILLALAEVRARAPGAPVVITPSDHHFDAPDRLSTAIALAVSSVRRRPETLALLGAQADRPATDLGWIVPDAGAPADGPDLAEVRGFVEKPAEARGQQLLRQGALWNTLIMVGSVSTFWRQANLHLPRQTASFEEYVNALRGGASRDDAAALLARLYRLIPAADFSRTVLEKAQALTVVRMRGAGWSDCGTPERLLACLGSAAAPVLRSVLLAVTGRSALTPDLRGA